MATNTHVTRVAEKQEARGTKRIFEEIKAQFSWIFWNPYIPKSKKRNKPQGKWHEKIFQSHIRIKLLQSVIKNIVKAAKGKAKPFQIEEQSVPVDFSLERMNTRNTERKTIHLNYLPTDNIFQKQILNKDFSNICDQKAIKSFGNNCYVGT